MFELFFDVELLINLLTYFLFCFQICLLPVCHSQKVAKTITITNQLFGLKKPNTKSNKKTKYLVYSNIWLFGLETLIMMNDDFISP
jgi:hypothetical protein